jgi:hypothetical protein
MLKMVTKITPRLYQISATIDREDYNFIFTDVSVALETKAEFEKDNYSCGVCMEYADESTNGVVDWITSSEL